MDRYEAMNKRIDQVKRGVEILNDGKAILTADEFMVWVATRELRHQQAQETEESKFLAQILSFLIEKVELEMYKNGINPPL